MKKIILNENSVFKSTTENIDNFGESFFNECYVKAYKSLGHIISFYTDNDNNIINDDEECNNIIAFVGDRGSGKTSTMKSFTKSLSGINAKKLEKLLKDEIEHEKVKAIANTKFEILNIIDPSLFSSNESLVEIIVAEMFKNFKNISIEKEMKKRQQLVKQFGQVFQDIKAINMEKQTIFKESNDNIETLIELSSGLSLKQDLKTLIELYINYMSKDGIKTNSFLVIPIDDVDMNFNGIENILEDIRKYLVQSNTIIILSAKFEQLLECVSQCYYKSLKENFALIRNVYHNEKNDSLIDFKGKIEDKSEKYLEKLIPYNRRIFMPTINSLQINIEIDEKYFNNIKTFNSISKCIKENFVTKLNYYIITEKHYRSIIPTNLRELIELFVMLNSMKDEEYSKNLLNIRQYYTSMVINKLNKREEGLFLRDLLYCEFKELKKRSLIYLTDKIINEINEESLKSDDLMKDVQYINNNSNLIKSERVTLGDLITIIKLVELIADSNEKQRFLEVCKSIITLRFLHAKFNNKISISEIIGNNIIGKYFYITNNINKEICNYTSDLRVRGKTVERIENITGEKLEMNEELLVDILQPRFEENSFYSRLIRRENVKYDNIDNLQNFRYFYFFPMNIVNSVLDGEIKYILNIDCYLEILIKIDIKLNNLHMGKIDMMKSALELWNKIYFNQENFTINIGENKNYSKINIINEDIISSERVFIENVYPKISIDLEKIKIINKCIEAIEKRVSFIDRSKEFPTTTLIKTIKELKDYDDNKSKFNEDEKEEINKLTSQIDILKKKDKVNKEDEDIKKYKDDLINLKNILSKNIV